MVISREKSTLSNKGVDVKLKLEMSLPILKVRCCKGD